jgi:hypothetical protein
MIRELHYTVTKLARKTIKGTMPRDFFLRFFTESSSPKPLKITRGSWDLGVTDPCRKPEDENLVALSL